MPFPTPQSTQNPLETPSRSLQQISAPKRSFLGEFRGLQNLGFKFSKGRTKNHSPIQQPCVTVHRMSGHVTYNSVKKRTDRVGSHRQPPWKCESPNQKLVFFQRLLNERLQFCRLRDKDFATSWSIDVFSPFVGLTHFYSVGQEAFWMTTRLPSGSS